MSEVKTVTPDPWGALREHTPARIALGRSGASMPTEELLRFGFAHAQARDAVHIPLDADALEAGLQADGWPVRRVHSAAQDRATYLLRPDLGRRLGEASKQSLAEEQGEGCDLLIVVGDGLSSLAVSRHARPLIAAIRAQADPSWRFGPIVVAEQARVALGDPIGAAFKAKLVAVLIGERPGLSSPDSLGIYLTWEPRTGRSDAERNCISNVRPEGLGYAEAAHKLLWLAGEALRRKLTGVALKDMSDVPVLGATPARQLST
jgi:ethanolamine ammonia-lyase small subunit